jgi:hypothetical protein
MSKAEFSVFKVVMHSSQSFEIASSAPRGDRLGYDVVADTAEPSVSNVAFFVTVVKTKTPLRLIGFAHTARYDNSVTIFKEELTLIQDGTRPSVIQLDLTHNSLHF